MMDTELKKKRYINLWREGMYRTEESNRECKHVMHSTEFSRWKRNERL